jgi:2-phospho-L-lactate/phosphoenolpyruvate guanylyltransferase
MRTLALLPVKSFTHAKQRLRTGLHPDQRRALAEAMLRDVLSALTSTELDGVIVITAARTAREVALEHGADVLEDRERGHNAAARLGLETALEDGAERALLVPGDCPAVDPAEVDALLARRPSGAEVVIVPDRHGTGTNALLLAPPDALEPSFGPGSCRRHAEHARATGLTYEVQRLPSLALDIDTPEDLAELARLGDRAPMTNALLAGC